MTKAFSIERVGHVGINVRDVGESIAFYRDVMGMTLTGRWPLGPGGDMAFMRFGAYHHDLVMFKTPRETTEETRDLGFNGLNHIAIQLPDRDEWLKALQHIKDCGVEITDGPMIHGPEGGDGPGTFYGGSGSRSFYIEDPNGNTLELITDMMTVPEGEQFPREIYSDVFPREYKHG